jgi:ComF family protein
MKKAGISCHVKLMSYGEGDAHSVTRRVIATIKKRGANRAFRYLAEELKPGVLAALRDAKNESGTKPETVISFLPRSAEARRKIGYDQAERLAKALAKSASLPYQPLFTRQRNGLAQKMLRRSERVENVRGAFALRQEVYGKRVVLVDDLVTTGAGMAEAAKLLYRADAADVIAVSIALTEKKKGKEDYFSR